MDPRIGEEGTFTIPEVTVRPYPTIKKGSRGEAVAKWQRIVGVKPDGNFGSGTDAATKTWQAGHGLQADGVVGPLTWQTALQPMSVPELVNVELGPAAPGAAPLPGGVPNSPLPPQFVVQPNAPTGGGATASTPHPTGPAVTEAGFGGFLGNLPTWAKWALGLGIGAAVVSETMKAGKTGRAKHG